MTNCTIRSFEFPAVKGRKVVANFDGGFVSSDASLLLVAAADKRIGLTQRVAQFIKDERDQSKIAHTVQEMLSQRVYGLCLGYEDLNDHKTIRTDLVFQTSVGKDTPLASSSTLCRLENNADKELAFNIHQVSVPPPEAVA